VYNIVIIGGMAAGCKAAARLSRLSSDYQIILLEKSPYISISSCGLPLYVSGEIDITELTKTPYGIIRDKNFFKEFEGITVLTNTEATDIKPWKREVVCIDHEKNENLRFKYDALILATGSKPEKPSFPFPQSPFVTSLYSPSDSKKLREAAQNGRIKKVVIIGGGNKGCETAESLVSLWGIETIIIEEKESLLNECIDYEFSKHIENCIKSDKILTLLSTKIEKIETDINGLPVVVLDNGQKIVSDYVIYCTGLTPDTELAKKTNVKLGNSGGIIVDDKLRTSIPNIWAAGDCVETNNIVTGLPGHYPGGSLSNRLGRAVADSIKGTKISFKGTTGATSLKLFDNIICSAGLTERKAEEFGYTTGSVIGIWSDKTDFQPDVKNIFGKLVYQKPGLKLLGLQLIGGDEVIRYIDVFSELLKERRTLKALLCLEHAFYHSHSSPLSPLNYLGYIAVNQEKEGIINFKPIQISSFNGLLIDVREMNDVETKPLPVKSINIPFSCIRSRVGDFDLNQEIIFVCTKGSRSYESARLFANNGYKHVAYLGGGSLLLSELNKVLKLEELMS
jgi:NADPH-dependent 2,4-dienoyl-CoA reductase/sulfur reductase-like enzyme/rhodanese-related sulfurtransferase